LFNSTIYSVIGIFVINSLLLYWETVQIISTGRQYFFDLWKLDRYSSNNSDCYLDYFRDTYINMPILNWVVVLLSIVRGITGFRAFTMTRYYIGLILVSAKKITSFVIIFIYTTLSYGLLRLVAMNEKVELYTIWHESFLLVAGKTDKFESENLDLLTITFIFAVFLNVILMLNMIISILGDSVDEF
jgi:hypothetical protein